MIKINLLGLHILLYAIIFFSFERADGINLAFSLLISFLIINEYLNDKFYFLSANKIFLLGGYYYLVVFPFFYSIGFIKAETFSSNDLSFACLASLLAIVGYIIGRNLFLLYSPAIDFSHVNKIDNFYGFGKRKIDIFLLFVFFTSMIFFMNLYSSITTFLNLGLLVVLFSYAYFHTNRKLLKNIFLLSIFIFACFVTLSISGSRVDLIKIFISTAFLYLFLSKKRIKLSYFIMFGGLLFIGAVYATIFRTWSSIEDDLGAANIFEAYYMIFDINKGFLGFILALGDIGIAYDNLIYLVREIDSSNLLMGVSLIRPLFIIIPRSLWASKPLDTQSLIVEERLGEGLSEFGGGTSQSITLVGDFFWNFSFFGPFMGFVIFGFLIIFFDKKIHHCKSITSLMFMAVLIPFFFVSWRGAFSSQLIYTAFSIIPLIFLIILHKIFIEFKISPKN